MLEYVFFDPRPRDLFVAQVSGLGVETEFEQKGEELLVMLSDELDKKINDRIEGYFMDTLQMSEDLMAEAEGVDGFVVSGVDVKLKNGDAVMASVDAKILEKLLSVLDFDEQQIYPSTTYYDPQNKAESLFSIFLVGLFFPHRMLEGLPAASGLKNSAVLLACYLVAPSVLMTTTFGAVASSLAPNFFIGVLIFISILPISLAIGVSSTWLWAKYLSWSLSILSGRAI